MRGLIGHAGRLPAPLIYAGAMAWTKGLAMLSVPLFTRQMLPAEFGRLELLSSAAEIGGLIAGAGLVDTLYRFASGADGRRHAAGVMGLALLIAAVGMILVVLGAPMVAAAMPLATTPLEVMLLGTAVVLEGVIGVPLGWLRMHGRAGAFGLLTAGRATVQVGLGCTLVLGGFGVSGVLTAGAVAGLLLAGLLTMGQAGSSGIRIERGESLRLLAYGLPLVGGGLAAFVLGSADRWWLAGVVTASALGVYGLAAKIAAIVSLLAQPFELWWYPRRLAVLAGPDGQAKSSVVVMAGLAMLMLAGGAVSLAAPLLVRLLAPAAYAGAVAMVPPLALAIGFQLAASMANAGCYARRTGAQALAINLVGAAVALGGYAAFIPTMGVEGAILATVLSQGVRFVVFAVVSQRVAPLDWRFGSLAGVLGLTLVAVWLGGAPGWFMLAGAAGLALVLRLVPWPGPARLGVV